MAKQSHNKWQQFRLAKWKTAAQSELNSNPIFSAIYLNISHFVSARTVFFLFMATGAAQMTPFFSRHTAYAS